MTSLRARVVDHLVSILVLVDAALRPGFYGAPQPITLVSILVLVDAALRLVSDHHIATRGLRKNVSILVLVDAALRLME